MVAGKKIEKNCLLHSLSIQSTEFLPSRLVNKDSLYIQNQLHPIVFLDICYCQIGHIALLGLYKLEKWCLRVKLQRKIMSQCSYYIFSTISY